MGLTDRIRSWFVKPLPERVALPIHWQIKKGRPIKNDPDRDLSFGSHAKMRKNSQHLFRSNPIAKRGIENICSFITSEGFAPRATCEDDQHRDYLQKWLDAWWRKNDWDRLLPKRYETLSVEGEWFFWRSPCDAHGISRLCYLRPERVMDVSIDDLDAERFLNVKLSPAIDIEIDGKRERREELSIADPQCPCGEVLYFQLNSLTGQTRGVSDLLVVADWLDYLSTTILTEIERVQHQRAYAWFVNVKGEEPGKLAEIQARIQADGPPDMGSVIVCNESESWEAKSPELHLQDSVEFIKYIMYLCFGGLYMPEHYFATGGDVNKATSANMDTPIFAIARQRKKDLKEFISLAIRLDLKKARELGVFANRGMDTDSCFDFSLQSRDPDRSAYDLLGDMLTRYGGALKLAREMGWINETEAAQAFRIAATGMGLGDFPGVDIDSIDKAEEEIKSQLEFKKEVLSRQYPMAEDAPKKKLKDIFSERNEIIKASSMQASKQADALIDQFKALAANMSGPIDLAEIQSALDQITPGPMTRLNLKSLANNGKEVIDKVLLSPEFAKPAAKVEVENLNGIKTLMTWDERVDANLKDWAGRHLSKNLEFQNGTYFYHGDLDFGIKIRNLALKAQQRGIDIEQFLTEISPTQIREYLKLQAIEVQEALASRAEGAVMSDYAFAQIAAGKPQLKRKYVKVSDSQEECRCHEYDGQIYYIPGTPGSDKTNVGPRLPIHPYCRCKYFPVTVDVSFDGIKKILEDGLGEK